MLIDRARVLTARIAELQELRNFAADAERFRTRTEQLETPLEALRSLGATWKLFQMRNIPVSIERPYIAALKSHLQKALANFRTDPGNILEANQEFNYQFIVPMRQYPERLRESMLFAWQGHLDTKRPRVPEDILSILWNIMDFREQVTTIKRLNDRVDELAAVLPKSQAVIEEAESVCNGLTEAWRNLQGDGIPHDVLEFIKKASNQGSSFVDLSMSIHDWLKSRDLLKRFKIITMR
jgi:hypothetical protein